MEPAEKGADFKFRYYNADGGEAEMCGNGARCFGFFTAHLSEEGEIPSSVSFETMAGTLTAEMVGDDVRIAMSDTLSIGFEKTGDTTFGNVTLTDPADFVFEGEIEI